MNKFYGNVGFVENVETFPGVWQEIAVEKEYYGDVIRNSKRSESSGHINDNLVVVNTISIVADAYATEHFFAIRYVEWMNSKWKVSSVEVQRPRIIMTLGEVYNGPTPGES